jgi:hypothetical protein
VTRCSRSASCSLTAGRYREIPGVRPVPFETRL